MESTGDDEQILRGVQISSSDGEPFKFLILFLSRKMT